MLLNAIFRSRALRRSLAAWLGSVLVAVAGLVSVLVVPDRHLPALPVQVSAAGGVAPARQPVAAPRQATAPGQPAARSTL